MPGLAMASWMAIRGEGCLRTASFKTSALRWTTRPRWQHRWARRRSCSARSMARWKALTRTGRSCCCWRGTGSTFSPSWRNRIPTGISALGRYRRPIGVARRPIPWAPIVRGPHDGDRRLYVLEPGTWGCFVRAQVEGDQDLLVEVHPISLERARELLATNPAYFPDEPDEASKLRKLQASVEVRTAARTEFRVTDPSRARRVIDS